MGGILKELLPLGRAITPGRRGVSGAPVLRHVIDLGMTARVDVVALVVSSGKAAALMEAIAAISTVPLLFVHQTEASGLGGAVAAGFQIELFDLTVLIMPSRSGSRQTALLTRQAGQSARRESVATSDVEV
jgi:hypothetical protein